MVTKKLAFPLFLFTLFALSCSKEPAVSEEDRIVAERATEEYLMAEQIFENIFQSVDKHAKQQGSLNGFKNEEADLDTRGCPSVNFSTSGNGLFPAILELDFGSGCNDNGNALVAGKITAEFTGLLWKAGTTISLSFTDYSYAGYGVTGTYEIANLGENVAGEPTYTATVAGQLTRPDGKSFSYISTTTSAQTQGNDTNFFTNGLSGILDDVWSTTREASLLTSDGVEVVIGTPSAIQHPLTCIWPVSGAFSLNISEPDVAGSIDFGSGKCDDKALLTIGDYSVELDL
jgi:hypothetical protein